MKMSPADKTPPKTSPKTLCEKIWEDHVVHSGGSGAPDLLYIDLHLIHEVTSPQAFDGLKMSGRPVRRPDLTIATEDHNVPTQNIDQPIADPISAKQIQTLRQNCEEHQITLYQMGDPNQGIVHVIGPEQGITLPGTTIVCGDSHTSTHGAFGALAFGIGTSEIEHVLATQTLPQSPQKTMVANFDGELPVGSTPKDVALAFIGEVGTTGGAGYLLEYRGSVVENMTMEGRMTLCNMSIEAGARAGLIAPDQTTYDYLEGLPHAPKGENWKEAVAYWKTLPTDKGATYDKVINIAAKDIPPYISWGTNPSQVAPISGSVPNPEELGDENLAAAGKRALEYMGLEAGTAFKDIGVDTVFIGSCTNSRIEDLRQVAEIVKGKKVATGIRTLVVPGSGNVKAQAEDEGIDRVLTEAGFDWREPGCSMCLGMNPDTLTEGERCASTSNRNFEGRQGRGGRTHLVSPPVAAATAIKGKFATPEDL